MKKEGYSIRSPMHRSDTDTDTDADTDTDTDTVSALRCCHDINRCDQIRSDQIRSHQIIDLFYHWLSCTIQRTYFILLFVQIVFSPSSFPFNIYAFSVPNTHFFPPVLPCPNRN